MQDPWAGHDDVELRLLEHQLRTEKTCECGERFTNDDIGSVCPACGRSVEDYTNDVVLMHALTSELLFPTNARANRAIH